MVSDQEFSPRGETMEQYWIDEAKRRDKERVLVQFDLSDVSPAQLGHLHDTKHQYGWIHQQDLPEGRLEMLFLVGSLPYIATWLFPFTSAVKVVEPAAVCGYLSELAQRAYNSFYQK
uniref:WYL domain-containing protein n=2 Tax=Dyadobacter sp. OTU695 TaxID=3043860 RepID=UPI00313BB4CC